MMSEKEMTPENKPLLLPNSYHNFDAIAAVLLRRMEKFGVDDALNYADDLAVARYGSDLPIDHVCLDVQRKNRRTLYEGLKATKILPEEFMQSVAALFGIRESKVVTQPVSAPALTPT